MNKILLILLLSFSFIYAKVGKITALKGEVIIVRDSANINGKLGSDIFKDDRIKTGKNARAQIVFKDNTIISLGKESTFAINDYLFEAKKPAKASFGFGKGIFKTITGKIGKINPKKFKLKTKTATIGIRGTIVGLESTDAGDKIIIPQGEVVVETPDGIATVGEGEMTEVKEGEAPVVTQAPQEEVEKVDEGSGAKANEEESGQGEATQTTELTPKEKEEAKEQQESEEEGTQEENTEESSKEESDEQKESEEEGTQEESTEKSEEGQPSQNQTTEEETPQESSGGGVSSEPEVDDEPIITVESEEPEIDTTIVDDIANDVQDAANDESSPETVIPDDEDEVTYSSNQYSVLWKNDQSITYKDNNEPTVTLSNNAFSFSTLNVLGGTQDVGDINISGTSSTYTTGLDDLGTLSLSRTKLGYTDNSQSYRVYSDSMREFFVADIDSTLNFNSLNYNYNEILYGGVNAKTDELEDKVYIYNLHGQLEIEFDINDKVKTVKYELEDAHDTSDDYQFEEGYLYVNGKTKSAHFVNLDNYYEGAKSYNAGYISGTNANISMKFFDIDDDGGSYTLGTGDGDIFGSVFQGIGIQREGEKIEDAVTTDVAGVSSFYLDKDKTSSSTIKSGDYGNSNDDYELTGFVSFILTTIITVVKPVITCILRLIETAEILVHLSI